MCWKKIWWNLERYHLGRTVNLVRGHSYNVNSLFWGNCHKGNGVVIEPIWSSWLNIPWDMQFQIKLWWIQVKYAQDTWLIAECSQQGELERSKSHVWSLDCSKALKILVKLSYPHPPVEVFYVYPTGKLSSIDSFYARTGPCAKSWTSFKPCTYLAKKNSIDQYQYFWTALQTYHPGSTYYHLTTEKWTTESLGV